MSICHIKFSKVFDEGQIMRYEVITPDLSDSFTEEKVGVATIDLALESFSFEPCGLWIERKALPPELFILPDIERRRKIENEYQGFSCSKWSIAICSKLIKAIRAREFPVKMSHIS